MGFEDVGPQWNRDEPWQAQQAGIAIRGLTDPSPWMRRQRRLIFGLLLGMVVVIALAIAVSAFFG